jgi:hypothetical protein
MIDVSLTQQQTAGLPVLSWNLYRTLRPPFLLPSEHCQLPGVHPQISSSAPIVRILPTSTDRTSCLVPINESRTAATDSDVMDEISTSRYVDMWRKSRIGSSNERNYTDVFLLHRKKIDKISHSNRNGDRIS